MITKQFLKSSLIYSVVGALPYASGFLLLIWFTAYLTPAQFGINVLYISLMYFIQIISTFGLDASASLMYIDYRDDKPRLNEFMGTILYGLVGIGVLTFIVFSFGGFRLFSASIIGKDLLELIPFGIITILSGIMNGIFKTYSTVLIYQQRPERFLFLNISNFIITIGASLAILFAFPFTLYGPVIGRFIAIAFTAILSMVFLLKEYGFKGNRDFIKPIFIFAFPILIYGLLTWVVSYIDRFIIVRFMSDPTQVAIFDFGVKIVLGIELLLIGLVNTVNPKVFNIWKEKSLNESTVEINRYYNGMTALFLLMIPLFVIFAPILIPIVIHKEVYYEAFGFLAILAAGYLMRIWFYMYLAPLLYFKKTKALPRVFAISAIIDVILGIFLIKYFGLIGAVWTNFLIKPVQALLLYLECRKIYTFKINPWKIFYTPIIFILTVLLSETFAPPHLKFQIELLQLFVAAGLVYFAYRKELWPMLMKFTGR